MYVLAYLSFWSPLGKKRRAFLHSGSVCLPLLLTLRDCIFSSNLLPSMEDSANSADIALLRTDPHELLVRYQPTVRLIVRSYVRTRMFLPSEFDDIVQHLNRELLEKLPRISEQYNGMSLFRTYFANIVRHACLSLHRKRQSSPSLLELDRTADLMEPGSPDNKLLIEHDIRVFRAIMEQFHSEKAKLLLCLKLMYRVPITRLDVVNWWPGCPENEISAFLIAVNQEGKALTHRNVFGLFQPLVNGAETNHITADSTRHWADVRITLILRLLNGTPPNSAHNRETLGILFEDYCAPFLLSQ
jgi:RNA polymerase sigma factor (sigma-70 family)